MKNICQNLPPCQVVFATKEFISDVSPWCQVASILYKVFAKLVVGTKRDYLIIQWTNLKMHNSYNSNIYLYFCYKTRYGKTWCWETSVLILFFIFGVCKNVVAWIVVCKPRWVAFLFLRKIFWVLCFFVITRIISIHM